MRTAVNHRFNFAIVSRLSGQLLIVLAAILASLLALSLWADDGAAMAFAFSAAVVAVVGSLLRFGFGRHAATELRGRESFWMTSVVWLLAMLCGSLPYMFYGAEGFTNALFESVSGFTTTGSSVIARPEQLPPSLQLWRCATQWLGGLGLVLLIVAINPRLASGSLQLYDAEFSGTQQRKLHPHIAVSVSRMWRIYAAVTVAMVVALRLGGESLFQSVCLAMSTVSTGGFLTSSSGLAGANASTMTIVIVFMFLSGVNVAMIYNFVTFKWRRFWHNEELLVYTMLFVVATALCTTAFVADGNTLEDSARFSVFHVASTVSTCGFFIARPAHWSFLVSVVTFLLMFIGASSGSTGGGLKIRRLLTLVKYMRNYVTRMIHPNVVFSIKIDHETVPAEYVNKIFAFAFLYISFVIGGGFVLTLCGSNIPEALSMAAANMANLGPSPLMDAAGSMPVYSVLPLPAKLTLMVLMLAGRLEIFALLAIFSPAYNIFRR